MPLQRRNQFWQSLEEAFPESDARGVRLTLITFPQHPGLERIRALRPTQTQTHRFKIQDYFIISSEKLKRGRTLTTSQYAIYFKTQRTVIENTKVT